MSDAPRLLFVADAPAAIEALGAVRAGGPVRGQLAPTADVLRDTLAAPGATAEWDAVVFVPGGAVEEVELAVYVPDGLRLFVVDDEVPLLLMGTAAEALPEAALGDLVARLAAPDADEPLALPEAAPPTDSLPEDAAPAVGLAPDADPAEEPDPSAVTDPGPDPFGDPGPRAPAGPVHDEPVPEPVEPPVDPFATAPLSDPTSAPMSEPVAGPADLPQAPPETPMFEDAFATVPVGDAPLVPADTEGPADPWTPPIPTPFDPGQLLDAPTSGADAPEADHHTPEVEDGAAPVAMSDDLASLAEHLPIGLYRTAPDGRILYANPALHTLLGTDEPIASLDVRSDFDYPREAFEAEMAAHGEVRNLVVTWTRPDGETVHTRENARCLRDADGAVVAYEGTLEDVTDEVEGRNEERALIREHRAVAAFASASALADDPASIHCAAAGALLDATEAGWAALLTRSADGALTCAASAGPVPGGLVERIGQTPALADAVFPFQPMAGASVVGSDPQALRDLGVGTLASVPVERAGRRFGALVWGRAERTDLRPTEGHAAEALAWHLGGQLERVAAREALRDTEATLAVVAEHTPHVLYRLRYTPEGPVTDFLSPAAEALTGYTRAVLAERGGLRALIDRSESSEGAGLLDGPAEGADRYRAVYRLATAYGPRWVEDAARPWLDAGGRVLGLVGVVSDVTERREREAALAKQAEQALARQRALVDLAGLQGEDAYGAPAAAVVAATLEAAGVSFWAVADTTCAPLFAPPPRRLGGSIAPAVRHVSEHRALAIDDVTADERVEALGIEDFVEAYGLTALLVAPVRRDGRVAGLVAVHHTDGPHAWDPAEAEFAGAVADAIALALERDDRDLALAELEEARRAAEGGRAEAVRADHLKSAFLTTLSAEVRAPLTTILEHADRLADAVPAPHRGPVVRIARSGRQLLDTLDAVLDLSRLEAGDLDLDAVPTALAAPVRDAAAPFQGVARGKGLRLDLDLDPSARAAVDVAAVKRMVGHLVENAVAFTDDGGIHVAVEADGDHAVVRVADTGRGISAAFLPEACDPFRTEDPDQGGAGLGLAIARRLAERMGGRLEIASERPGGTVVTVAFPGLAPAPDPDADAQADPAEGDGHADADPGDLLGNPFDFTFLTAPPALRPAARTLAPTTPAPSDMFDFQFGHPQPSDPDPAATPEAAADTPEAATDAPPAVEPVLFVRPRETGPPARPTIPPAPTQAVEEAEVVSDGRPSVLVVEDNDDTRMLLERILRTTYAVTAVGDARSALLAMNQRRFSGLVLDINLGGKETGADVLRIARTLPDYGGVFAIALTAYALPGDRERLLESGFNAYISKPFTRSALMETLADGVKA